MTPIQRLIDFLSLEKKDILLLFVLASGYGLLGIATPIAVQTLVNIVTMGGVLQPLVVVSSILFFLLLLSGALYVFERHVVELIQRRLFVRVVINVAKNGQGVDSAVYSHSNPVGLMNHFLEISTIQKSVATLLSVSLMALLQGLIGSFVLIFYSLYFAIVVFVLLLLSTTIVFVWGKEGIKTAIYESKAKHYTATYLEAIAKNQYAFKFFNGQDRARRLGNDLAYDYTKKRQKHYAILLYQNISAVLLYAIIGTLMLALGGGLVITGQINLGQFVAAELIVFGVLASVVRVINQLEYFYDLLASLDKVGDLDDLPQESVGTYPIPGGTLNHLGVFKISYNPSLTKKFFKDVSFKLSRGESIAILGESGAGKTTLVGAITGLRRPPFGRVEYNGTDLRQLDQNLLRNNVGIAGRIEIIEGSVIDNILLNRDGIALNDIHHILEELGLLNDLTSLEQGLEAKLTSFGAPLSTTQLQRLMLARAIVGKPNLLIIDGMLDNLTPKELGSVLRLFKAHQQDWMLIVATRFQHIANQFDQIVSLNM